MNETHSYDPDTFHPSITHSVYGTLEGSRLRLAYPLASNETSHEAIFCRSCTFRLVNCKVSVSAKHSFVYGSQERGKLTSCLNSHLSAPTVSSNTGVKDTE